ncbi:MAG: C_GCAxxG_C_C family protein [Mailhella sp.]|jgi:C_GCAxxG_C_C family probable redox protein|nr:C_GCAxxG_C_C family protein [Mailhella sp.]
MSDHNELIHHLYHDKDYNCAITTLICLGKEFGVEINQQVLDSAICLNGGGRFRGQCGLVEGALMFIGICSTARGMKKKDMMKIAYGFCEGFTSRFGSLLCRDLRPGGFQKDDPKHLCEPLTKETVAFAVDYLKQHFPQN